MVVVMIPLPYSSLYVPPEDLGKYLQISTECILTNVPTNLTTYSFDHNTSYTSFLDANTTCENIFGLFMVFLILNIFQNVINIFLIRETTTNITVITGVASVTISDLGFCLLPLAGVAYKNLDSHDWLSSVVIVLGVLIFWSMPERAAPKETYDTIVKLEEEQEFEYSVSVDEEELKDQKKE